MLPRRAYCTRANSPAFYRPQHLHRTHRTSRELFGPSPRDSSIGEGYLVHLQLKRASVRGALETKPQFASRSRLRMYPQGGTGAAILRTGSADPIRNQIGTQTSLAKRLLDNLLHT